MFEGNAEALKRLALLNPLCMESEEDGGGGKERATGKRTTAGGGKSVQGSERLGGEWAMEANPAWIAKRLERLDRIKAKNAAAMAALEKPAITVTLPDGKQMPGVAWETTPLDIADIDTVSQLVQFPRYFDEDPGSSYDDFARGSTMMLDGREFMLRVHNEDMDEQMIFDGTDRNRVKLSFSAMDESGDVIDVYHKRWFFRGSSAWPSDRRKHKDGFHIEDYSGDALVTREVASIPGTEEMLENWYDQSSVDPWGEGLGRGGVTEDQIRDAIDADVLIPSIEHIRKLFSEDRAKALRAIIAEIGGTPVF